ncbi:MAG: hypothetical protein JOZ47_14045 [Kutzneria sp.]|nr:hypothetical protein [Kutzneria sp.]MBV9846173.1 hypothetical protein [Kutzneria sp.]
MSAPTAELVDQVRQVLDAARQAGEQAPGRPTLAKLVGASEYQVRQALAVLATEDTAATPTLPPYTPVSEELAEEFARFASSGDSPGGPSARLADADRHEIPEPATSGPGTAPAGEELADPGESLAPALAAPGSAGASHSPAGGKLVAWSGFLFGSVTSIAANVLAARIAPEHAPKDWTPSLDAQLGAAVWPLGLLLSVEVLSRVRWPQGWLWALAKYGGAGTVALGSAVISYGHIRDVLTSWGYSPVGAGVGPLVIDGLMTICGFAMLATAGDQTANAGASPATEGGEPA